MEPSKIFKYKLFDTRAKIITVASFLILGALVYGIVRFFGEGGYVAAWIIALLIAILALFLLSIPRKIVVEDNAVEIRCLVEITRLRFSDLRSVRRLEHSDMKRKLPLLGSYGFFGYYGYYIDLRDGELVKLYCGEWDNFVVFTDIFEKKVIVSCPDPEGLVASVKQACKYYTVVFEEE